MDSIELFKAAAKKDGASNVKTECITRGFFGNMTVLCSCQIPGTPGTLHMEFSNPAFIHANGGYLAIWYASCIEAVNIIDSRLTRYDPYKMYTIIKTHPNLFAMMCEYVYEKANYEQCENGQKNMEDDLER